MTRPVKLFVNFLFVTKAHFLFTLKDLENFWLSRLQLGVYAINFETVPHNLNVVSDTNCCRRKFEIILSSKTIYAHFSKICFWGYAMVICYFRINTAKDNKNWLLFGKRSARRAFQALGFAWKLFLSRGMKEIGPALDQADNSYVR
jgi:hypothetical protein